jgi:DNA-binding NarL/FixJ family response regulator
MIRILIADDQRVFRTALSRTLDTIPDIEIVGEASDGGEAVRLAEELQPDVILMDVAMPILDGIEATRWIRERCPQARIIGLSIYEASGIANQMREAGAVAYVPKAQHWDALLSTIYSVGQSDDQIPCPT